MDTTGGLLSLSSDATNSNKSNLLIRSDVVSFMGDKSQSFPIAMDFVNNTFTVNGSDVLTVDNLSDQSIDADTLNGIDSTEFARLDQVNTFVGLINLEGGVTVNGGISLLDSSDVEYANITESSITYDGANVWATSAQLSVAGITTGAINASSVTADTVTANTTLNVNGVDVGQWIANCEAGVSPGCSL